MNFIEVRNEDLAAFNLVLFHDKTEQCNHYLQLQTSIQDALDFAQQRMCRGTVGHRKSHVDCTNYEYPSTIRHPY